MDGGNAMQGSAFLTFTVWIYLVDCGEDSATCLNFENS